MKKFKAGDKVYFPYYGTDVFEVQHNEWDENLDKYPFMIAAESLTIHGKTSDRICLQSIFHATEENRALLEKLYGTEFEKPPVKLTSHEIIAAMLERGDKSVHCWVSDTVEEPSSNDTAREIHYIEDGEVTYYVDTDGNAWFFATPFDPRTNKAITELLT